MKALFKFCGTYVNTGCKQPIVCEDCMCCEKHHQQNHPSQDLHFQRYSHDKTLGGTAPGVDGGPVDRKRTTQLTPRAFHELTGDKSVAWELEVALRGLEDCLK